MKKILLIVGAVLAAAVVTVLALASQKPDAFHVERSAMIDASPSVVYSYVSNLENGQKWSPWVEMDPDAAFTFEGPVEGEGAILHWEGKKSGKGTLTITEARPNELVRMRLDFKKPMEGTSTAEYRLEPADGGTKMTWAMDGENNFMGKIMSVFMDCETMIGEQFEKGLVNLQTLVKG